jgi:hypothetical protein
MALRSPNRVNGEKATLDVMAKSEGLTVTTEMRNAYIPRVNSLCDQYPTCLYALQASAAYVGIMGGP